MKKFLLFIVPLLFLGACGHEKTYVVNKDAFCINLEEDVEEPVFCKDEAGNPINGKVIQYYPNGKKHREMIIRDGRENGIEKEYYENGKLYIVANVVDGHVDGTNKIYGENGKLFMELNWANGELKNVTVFDEKGKVVATQEVTE